MSEKRDLKTVKSCATRGSEMVRQIHSFARGIGGRTEALQIRPILAETARLLRETFPRSIHIRVNLAAELPMVVGDPTQLYQVLMNMCINARDAMPEGGDLELAADSVALKDHLTKGWPKPVSGRYVVLSVSDTGHGMSPEVLANIFQSFFTTKAEGKGTGLGLCTVLGIARSHNGFVDVSSRLGKGTIVKVYLPEAASTACPPHGSEAGPVACGEGRVNSVGRAQLAKPRLRHFSKSRIQWGFY